MADVQLSSHAQKLLKHFQDKKRSQRDFEYPTAQADLFDDVEDCEAAQIELGNAGLLELSQVDKHATSRVASAALTLDGVRYLAKNTLK